MKVATWNVNGIRARAAQVREWLERDRPEVVCLQELKAEPAQVPEACRLEDYHVLWHGMRAYSGVSLHIHKSLHEGAVAFEHPPFDMESRIVTAQVERTVFASVYVPNGGKSYPAKIDFLKALASWGNAVLESGRDLILCGDINVTRTERDVHPKERNPGVIGQLPEERELFERLLGGHLVDIGREADPQNEGLFTWWPPWRNMRQRNIGWRIDYLLASKPVAARATGCRVLAEVGTSDHAPVMMEMV